MLVMYALFDLNLIQVRGFNTILSVPIISVLIFLISLVLVYFIRKKHIYLEIAILKESFINRTLIFISYRNLRIYRVLKLLLFLHSLAYSDEDHHMYTFHRNSLLHQLIHHTYLYMLYYFLHNIF